MSGALSFENACTRLYSHANFPSELAPYESLGYLLRIADRSATPVALSHAREDILTYLETLNRYLNGEVPSETAAPSKLQSLDRKLVYSVAAIIGDCACFYIRWTRAQRFTRDFREEVAKLCATIASAWEALLAGDVDSIESYLAAEQLARGM